MTTRKRLRQQDIGKISLNTEDCLAANHLFHREHDAMINRNTVSHTNKDETYFRARLALMLKPALAAMSIRKKGIEDLIRKGIIPTIASSKFIQLMTTNIIINLTGIKESVYDILGYDINSGAVEILQKVMKTAVDVAADQGRHFGEDSIGVAMLHDDSAMRFAGLDSDKYGKISLLTQQNTPNYSQGITLDRSEE